MHNPAKPANMQSNSLASTKFSTHSGTIPNGLSPEQVVFMLAWVWINDPTLVYQGLKVAFNLAPGEGEHVQ